MRQYYFYYKDGLKHIHTHTFAELYLTFAILGSCQRNNTPLLVKLDLTANQELP